MGAFSIAFDIIIVGALALPWVLLIIHLFFSDDESSLNRLLDWTKKFNQPAVAGVLLFAVAYSLGSMVSRIAQDFFDDDDLYLHLHFNGYERWFGLPHWVTETSLLTSVYCQQPQAPSACSQFPDGRMGAREKNEWKSREQLDEQAGQSFRLQEAAVLLQGTDKVERMRQFHDQVMVLRGAAFNGMIAFALCLFWWCTRFYSGLRWAVPWFWFLPGVIALLNHLHDRNASDPPYMEFTLLALGAAGWYILRPEASKRRGVRPPARPAPEVENKVQSAGSHEPSPDRRRDLRFTYLLLSAFLTLTAFLGWWATQVLYDQQVLNSYTALSGTGGK